MDTADTVPDRVDEDCDGKVDEDVDATRARCPRGSRIITGTRGDDTLRGTSGRDCILGYGGNDTIYGEAGDDLIFAGPGDDRIFTGRGRDIVRAGSGSDVVDTTSAQIATVFGESGNDTLNGGSGNDTFFGGDDNDKANGGGGFDLLSGGGCHDYLVGGSSFDLVGGGSDVDACDAEITTDCERSNRTRKLCSNDGECSSTERCAIHSGFCVARSAKACGAGSACTPTATEDETCNGVDDDCNGTVDEDYLVEPTVCGEGACQATGETSCVDGQIVDSCDAVDPSGTDSVCNGMDDDCDGNVDEGFVSTPTVCGEGSCQATGATACVAGSVVDSCDAGDPTGTDAVCNGLDDDCDGSVDEGYIATPTSCGAGACAANGTLSCIAGQEVDSCQSGMPGSATDTICNGIDDDCDGEADEDYVPQASQCGLGMCQSTGMTSCVDGAVIDSCEPGLPEFESDTSCDNIDNDCDGLIDDNFEPTATTCGFGECERMGSTACRNGQIVDTCVIDCEGHCADGAEDDNDGQLDCEDPDCQDNPAWPQCFDGEVGSPCLTTENCREGLFCETNFPGGYCYQPCTFDTDCPSGSFCWASVACVQPCVGSTSGACPRPEHVCEPLATGGVATPFCRPDCAQSCPAGTTCRPDTLQCM